MKKHWFALAALVLVLVVGCSPRVAPTPAVAPATPPPQAPAPAPVAAPRPTAEEQAWSQVVEAAKKEGKVTLYTVLLTGDSGSAVAKAFRDRYGIALEFVTGVSAVLLERIKLEVAARKFIGDAQDAAVMFLVQSKDQGLTESAGSLPVFAEAGVWRADPRLDKDNHMFAFGSSTQASFMNTTLVKPEDAPRSYKDFLLPAWKGKKIALDSPLVGVQLTRLYVAGKKFGFLDDDFWRQLAKQEPIVGATAEMERALARGEGAIKITGNDQTMGVHIKEGAPIRALAMKEGTVQLNTPAVAVLKTAPHPNAARLYVNWLLSAEGQRVLHQVRSSLSIRSDIPDFIPEGARVTPIKVLTVSVEMEIEAAQAQREEVVAKLLGLGR